MSTTDNSTAVSPRRLIAFRILSAITGLIFLAAGLTNAIAPWTLGIAASDDAEPELNRWFITVAGSADLILAGALVALAWRPRQPLLILNIVVAAVVAAAINLPFVPEFAVILALVVPALATYPYWSSLRNVRDWWAKPHLPLLAIGTVAIVVVGVIAAVALSRQIGRDDAAADGNWWADYAEHVTLPAIAVLLASSRQAGWRLLAGLAAAVWIYLGLVAALSLPDHAGSWGVAGGVLAIVAGCLTAASCVQGDAPGWVLPRRPHHHPAA